MPCELVNRAVSALAGKKTGSNGQYTTLGPVGGGAYRHTWPQGSSQLPIGSNGRNETKRSIASLTNLAQWYLDNRVGSAGSTGAEGLVYSVPRLPPRHSAEAVAKALDLAVAALQSQSEEPALYRCFVTSPTPPAASEHSQAHSGPLTSHPNSRNPPNDHLPRPLPPLPMPLTDKSALLPVPAVRSTAVADYHATCVDPANLHAPLLPTTNQAARPGLRRPDIIPTTGYLRYEGERRQTAPQLRRKARMEDLKPRAASAPELKIPTTLQIGVPIPKPIMTRKATGQDSLKIRIPSGVKEEDIPPSLQHGGPRTSVSLGLDADADCRVRAVDVVKEDCELRADPVPPGLGKFPFERSSSPPFSNPNTLPPRPRVSSPSSAKKKESLQRVGKTAPHVTEMDKGSRDTSINRAPLMPARNGPPAKLALSNATLKALLSAEAAANQSRPAKQSAGSDALAQNRLSTHSAAVVREFSQFTDRRFFNHSVPQEARSQSDGTVVGQRDTRHRARADAIAATSDGSQRRARSAGELELRKLKGRGVVFEDPGEWKRHYGG